MPQCVTTLLFYRCSYAQLCYYILEDGSLTSEQFANELLPSLLSLGSDRIPNVRIALAKVLAQHIMHSGQYPHPHRRQGAGAAHHALRSVPSPSPSPRCWRSTSCTQVSTLTLTLAKVLAQHIMHSGQYPHPHPHPRQGAGAAHHALRSVPSPSPRCWRSTSCTQVSTLTLAKVLAQHIMHSGQYPHPHPRQGAGAAHHALRSVPSPSPSPRCWRNTSCTQVSTLTLTLAKVLAQHIMHSGQFHPKVCFVKAFLLSSSPITDHRCVVSFK